MRVKNEAKHIVWLKAICIYLRFSSLAIYNPSTLSILERYKKVIKFLICAWKVKLS